MNVILLLAQSTPTTTPATPAVPAEIGMLQIILQGGVPLILLVACYILLRYIQAQKKECVECRKAQDAREKELNDQKSALEREYRAEIVQLYREHNEAIQRIYAASEGGAR